MTDNNQAAAEPLPIWFFVGLILTVYGILILGSGLLSEPGTTVLAETRPAIWWGAIMAVFGGVFVAIGWLGRTKQ